MSDTETTVNDELKEADAALPTEPEKAPKVVKQPVPCACSRFLLADERELKEDEEPPLFDTECKSTTMSTFAQGHDARLVSFLVQGEFDGLTALEDRGGVRLRYDSAAHAAGSISEALAGKADAAIIRLHAAQKIKEGKLAARVAVREAKAAEKLQAKQVREANAAAAKAAKEADKPVKSAAPKKVAAKVVDGSQEGGDGPADGFIKIKVGRGEYDAIASEVDNGEGGTKTVYTYRNLQGEEETRDADTVRVLLTK